MMELRPTKTPFRTTLALAAALAASAAFAQMTPAPKTSPPETTGTMQAAPSGQAPAASSTDPLVEKRIEDKAANDEYKARKSDAKAEYKEEKKAAKSVRKAEKKEASAKRKEAMKEQGGMAKAPDTEGK